MKGTDHIFSLEPPGLRRVVRDLTRARLAIGDGRIYVRTAGSLWCIGSKTAPIP